MPLRDHFRSPVNDKHTWDSVHGLWPGMMVRELFDLLPGGYQAEPKIHLGSAFEVDVGTYDDDRGPDDAPAGDATQAALAPTLTVQADLTDQDEYQVQIYDTERERRLVATIEIVSPSNKDRPDTREVFVGKVSALLKQGVSVSVVDLVSVRRANLYAELLASVGRSDPRLPPVPPPLYAVTLRTRKPPRRRTLLDAWFYPMAVGEPLPTIPLWLTPDLRVMLPLETSYQETCRLLRIP